jgi:hypothetical protein
MRLYRAFLQTLGATALLALALACHGKSGGDAASANTANISGTVTYARVPLATDANGVPTGLADATVATNLKTLVARGVVVRVYQQIQQTLPDGTVVLKWQVAKNGVTDSNGTYSLNVAKDRPSMVEILSSFGGAADNSLVNVIAEPNGINSATGVLDRLRYAMRKAADGTAPASTNVPTSVLAADAVVDFSIGVDDSWWLVNPSFTLINGLAPYVDQAVLETTQPGRTSGKGSGSRILGIGDTISTFVAAYATATAGSTLDLHYWPGRSEPRGSYIEYDRTLFPQSFDTSTGKNHYFGSLRGGATNDDAWDEGVILPMLARNVLYAASTTRTFSVPLNVLFPPAAALTDLTPEMARIEGLADAMAANLLKSPYLADTQGTGLAAPVRDIRDISALSAAQKSPYSAPSVRALGWDVILKANSLPRPGTPTDWATITSTTAARFFLAPTSTVTGVTDSTGRDIEPLNIFSQLSRLKEGKSGSETVDLSAIFTDSVMGTLTAPYGLSWPRPTTGSYATFVADWGMDPTGHLPPVALSMDKAVQVNGVYPNLSQDEVFYAGFSLNADKRCVLSATITPALSAGAQIDVDLPNMTRTFSFTGSGGTTSTIVIPVIATAPYFHPVRIRLKSPTTLQPDVLVALTLTPAP